MKLEMILDPITREWREQIICDVCHMPIQDVGLAMVIWWENDSAGIAPAHVIHKGICDKFLGAVRRQHAPWQELTHFLERLKDIRDNDYAERFIEERNARRGVTR